MPKIPTAADATLGDDVTTEPGTLGAYAQRYIEQLRLRNYSPTTLVGEAIYMTKFLAWCEERDVVRPEDVDLVLLRSFQRYLHHYRRRDGAPLTGSTQWDRLAKVKRFFRWLEDEGHLDRDPSRKLQLPRVEQRLPRGLLNQAQAEAVLAQPDVHTVLGLRNRAILEVFYATGLRRAEVSRLTLRDVDALAGTVIVRQGKGRKDRLLPLSERACAWLSKYFDESRPYLVEGEDPRALFLATGGGALSYGHLGHVVRQAIETAGIDKEGACHLFRHTMATLMLEGGADIRYVQKMLGHANLKTTEVYTHVAIHKLREVHAATHPGARLSRDQRKQLDDGEPSSPAADETGDDAGDVDR